jgi:hypothetical protein
VNVPVPLLAAETEDVQPLRRNGAPYRLADAVDNLLEAHVLLAGEIARDLLAVVLRSDEHVSEQRGVLVQKRDGVLVFVNDVVRELGITCDQLADEAPLADGSPHRTEVDASPIHEGMIADAKAEA